MYAARAADYAATGVLDIAYYREPFRNHGEIPPDVFTHRGFCQDSLENGATRLLERAGPGGTERENRGRRLAEGGQGGYNHLQGRRQRPQRRTGGQDVDIKKLIQDKKLTDAERQVLLYILDHLDEALAQGVRDIARQNYTSTSTIMRLSHKMGYAGFVDMCYKLRTLTQKHTEQISEAQNFLDGFNLDSLLEYNSYDQLQECARYIAGLNRKFLFVYATGFSGLVGDYLAKKLTNMGRLCLFASGGDSVGVFENSLDSMGLFLCVSKSGETDLVRDKIKTARENGVPTVAITGERPNSVSQYADLWFRVEDYCKLDDQNVRPNTFFPQALMLTELIAYEYHRLCISQNENETDL